MSELTEGGARAGRQARGAVCRVLEMPVEPAAKLEQLADRLDGAYRRVQSHLPQNAHVRFDEAGKLILSPLDRMAEPLSLLALRGKTRSLLPRVDLPEVLLEIQVRTVHAGYNRKYFGASRGITYYNFTSDQFTGFHGIVIPGTTHEAPYLLEGLLEQLTNLRPLEMMADTAAYSDVLFGLFWLLGYQFSPRLADLGEARFWRLDPSADYGPLNALCSKNRIPSWALP